MRDPGLEAEYFTPDEFLLERELIWAGGQDLQVSTPENCEIRLKPAGVLEPEDFNGLKIALRNLSYSPICFGLKLYSRQSESWPWFSGGRELISPGRERTVFLPWESFGSYGQASGLQRISEIGVIFRREKGQTQPENIQAKVCGLWAARRKALDGPRLSHSGLARQLDCASLARAFKPCLKRSVLENLRILPPPFFPYVPGSLKGLMRGEIMGLRLGLPPDWRSDPYGELEWRHFLHRQHFLRLLSAKPPSRDSGRVLAGLLTDWILRNPVPLGSDGGAGPGWETLSVAWRLREWIGAFVAFWESPELGQEVKSLILRSVWEQARHLCGHKGHPGNWRLIEAASLSLCGLCFPGFRESRTWIALGLDRLAREARNQFPSDGAHCEVSPFYHALCAQACFEVRLACASSGQEYPADLARAEPAWFAALEAWQRPDGAWPSFNDSASSGRDYSALLKFAKRHRVKEALSKRSKPRLFAEAGIAVLRNRKAWALFKAGAKPLSHGHDDDLSLEFWLGRAAVLLDPGITSYAPSVLSLAYRAAESHNCLTCGLNLGRAEAIEYKQIGGLRLARAEREGKGIWHARELCLYPQGALVVRDSLRCASRADFRVNWQFSPGTVELEASGLSAKARDFAFRVLAGELDLELERKQGDCRTGAGFVSLAGKDVAALHLSYAFSLRGEASIYWIFHPPGQILQEGNYLSLKLAQGPSLRIKLAGLI